GYPGLWQSFISSFIKNCWDVWVHWTSVQNADFYLISFIIKRLCWQIRWMVRQLYMSKCAKCNYLLFKGKTSCAMDGANL
ncbi:hypothetical protein, partial [Eikenella sp. HMSC061C02]